MECPYASVVICAKHAPLEVLRSLSNQTFMDFEIILAQEKGIVNAMNKALKKAKGEIFIRIDDDVSVPPKWLEELLKPFDDPKVCGATGPTFIPRDLRENRDSISFVLEHRHSHILKWLMDYKMFAPAKIFRSGSVSYGSNFVFAITKEHYDIDHLEGTNWAMRTELIRKVGGFDYGFDGVAEWFDTDVVYKVKKLGYTIVYNPKAILWHLVAKGESYDERFDGFGRIKNWLRFHIRHSKFDHKKIFWLFVMVMYFIKTKGEQWLKSS